MKTNRNNAIAAGVLFIIAAVAAIIGALLYDPILKDSEYIIKGVTHRTQVAWGALFEIITAMAVIGTPIALYPVLKKHNQGMAIATIVFRLLEATMIIVGIISLLTIVTLNHEFAKEINPDSAAYLLVGKLLVTIHDWTFLFGPNLVLGPSTFLTGYLLYKLKLVPRFISIMGMVGGPMIFTSGILITFGIFPHLSLWAGLLVIPVVIYEMSLAIRLLVKGFNPMESDVVTVLR